MIKFILVFKSWLDAFSGTFSGLVVNVIVPFLVFLVAWRLLSVISSVNSRAKSAVRNALLAAVLAGGYSTIGTDALSFVRSYLGGTEPVAQTLTVAQNVSDYDL